MTESRCRQSTDLLDPVKNPDFWMCRLPILGARPRPRGDVYAAVALSPLPFAVTWIDTRQGAIPDEFPANVTAIRDGDPVALLARAPDAAFVAIMTHSHALDLDLTIAALGPRRFAFVGLIGSDTKRARFTGAMRKMGMADVLVDSLVCPIGLTKIADKAPAAIAIAVCAQLLLTASRAARYRGT